MRSGQGKKQKASQETLLSVYVKNMLHPLTPAPDLSERPWLFFANIAHLSVNWGTNSRDISILRNIIMDLESIFT